MAASNEQADPGAMLLDEIAALDAERARVEARIATKMLEFSDMRRDEAAKCEDPRVAKLEASFAADEIGLVLAQPTQVIAQRVADARRIRSKLPLVWLAWIRGDLDAWRGRMIADAARRLEHPDSIITLDDRVVEASASRTPGQLRAWLRRFVAKTEPELHRQRSKRERANRCVWVDHDPDGMSWVHALLPTTDATRIDQLLTTLAKKPTAGQAAAESRTLDQGRADVFADLLLGRIDSTGAPTGSTHTGATIAVTVPVTTLVGLDDAPGITFDGQIALPANLVRELAVEPGTLFYRLLTDPIGHILDVAEIGRYPSRKLRTAIQVRDGVCAFPTCSVPAMQCDNDHQIPAPRGPTSGENLWPLCRRHHRMKTFDIVGTNTHEGSYRWLLPSGAAIEPSQHRINPKTRPSTVEHSLAKYLAEYPHPIHRAA